MVTVQCTELMVSCTIILMVHAMVMLMMLCTVSTGYSNSLEQVQAIKEVIADMPPHNRLMLGWLMVHMNHIVENVSVVVN